MTDQERLTIRGLSMHNWKCIEELELKPGSRGLILRGPVSAGKTAVLQAIAAALIGADPAAVRKGATEAQIEVDMGRVVVRRTLGADGHEKRDVYSNGVRLKDRQASELLARIVGTRQGFDPVQWALQAQGGKAERRKMRDELLAAITAQLDIKTIWQLADDAGLEEEWIHTVIKDSDMEVITRNNHPLAIAQWLHDEAYRIRSWVNGRLKTATEAGKALAQKFAEETKTPTAAKAWDGAMLTAADVESLFAYQQDKKFQIEQWRKDLKESIARAASAATAKEALANTVAKIAQVQLQHDMTQDQVETMSSLENLEVEVQRLERAKDEAHSRWEFAQLARKAAEEQLAKAQSLEQDALTAERHYERELAEALQTRNKRAHQEFLVADLDRQLADLEVERKTWEAKSSLDEERVVGNVDFNALIARAELGLEMTNRAKEVVDLAEESSNLTAVVEWARDSLPSAIIARSNLPITGLQISGDEISYNGILLPLLGTSELMTLAGELAMAMNPEAGFILLDRMESMSPEHFFALAKFAEERGVQLIAALCDAGGIQSETDLVGNPPEVVMQNGEMVTEGGGE